MAGGKNNTQRIEILESQAANMSARLDVHDILIQGLKAVLEKGTEATEEHTSKITVIEEKVLVLVDLKAAQAAIVAIEKEHLGFRKDIEALQKWKDDLKKEKDEGARRLWAFGPNITAAIISSIIALLIVGINIAVSYWIKKP
jgi:hypothetical protein